MIAMMADPPERSTLTGQAAQQRQAKLRNPPGLEGPVREQPVKPGGHAESSCDIQHETNEQGDRADTREERTQAGYVEAHHANLHSTCITFGSCHFFVQPPATNQ